MARVSSPCRGGGSMLVVHTLPPTFPSFPAHHSKQHHEGGKRVLDVYSMEAEQKDKPSLHVHRLGGNEDPTTLYEQGPRTWPSLALRTESDQVLEGSGIIGWYASTASRREAFSAT